ncbi:MAG: UDP-N-acetylmuramate dehydrogenase [Mogibacterium sp.]|jgi:UDP-N-acetylmuramate dehydrogenase|nr:UDP-N-acetylmuramate dehydrogenase [Mogibacterium sp.]
MITEEVREAIEKISGLIPEERLRRDEPMELHTSFRTGGPAAAFAVTVNEDELSAVLSALAETGAEHMLIGNGSNLLVADEGYPGVIVKLGGDFEMIEQDEEDPCLVRVGAARLMSSASVFLTGRGLSGFEFASGIPGSIGGAVFMNAGAYGGEMKDVVESVRVMNADGSGAGTLSSEDMDFSYRHSAAEKGDMIILSAVLRLRKDEPEAIAARVAELAAKRSAKQPVNFPSAGSTFKRPVGGYAAALIEESGLKGYRAGGAEVSEKHAGFVINKGGATTEDVLAVMRHVREKVFEDSGIMLEPEVRLINCSL